MTASRSSAQGERSLVVTLNMERGKHLKYMPYAFTESGVAMLNFPPGFLMVGKNYLKQLPFTAGNRPPV